MSDILLPEIWGLIMENISVPDIISVRCTCTKLKNIIDKLKHPQFRKFNLLKVEKGCKTIMMGFWEELGQDQLSIIKEYNYLSELPSIGVISFEHLYDQIIYNNTKHRYEWMTKEHRNLETYRYHRQSQTHNYWECPINKMPWGFISTNPNPDFVIDKKPVIYFF